MPNLTAFLSFMVVMTFTPGPNNIMSLSNASRYGFIKSIRFNIGVFAGFFVVIGFCSIFSLTLLGLLPSIKSVITPIGALYILWLAWKTYGSSIHEADESGRTNTFLSGFFLQFVNPKVILYGIAIVSTFILPYYKAPLSLLLFSGFLAAVGFVATCTWALFGSIFKHYLMKGQKKVNIILSLLLVYCAVSLFF